MIASWGIFNQKGERQVLLPYKEKNLADTLLTQFNTKETLDYGKPYFLQVVKIPFTEIPRQIVDLTIEDRKIAGTFEDDDGVMRRWTKTFQDLIVQSVVNGRHLVTEKITTHYHRRTLKIIYEGVSYTREKFEVLAKMNWPEHYGFILVHLEF